MRSRTTRRVFRMEADVANRARKYVDPIDERAPVSSRSETACPIDLVHLSKQTFGERDLEAELLRLFDRQAAQIVARLSDPVMPDRRWRADLAHTLKGSARAIGAFGVAAAAESYEIATADANDLDPALAALSRTVADAHTAIDQLLAG
jgi:HPt (histidine-containing phosphotransfer) domain-containing protein